MLKAHQDILWLAGQVMLCRDFVEEVKEKGLDTIFAACPYGDLTDAEKATFKAAFDSEKLEQVIQNWWEAYDQERAEGAVPQAGDFWY